MKLKSLAVLLALAPAVATAQQVVKPIPMKQLAEKTVVTLPARAGQFKLVDAALNNGGVRATYTFEGAPKRVEMVVDVVPVGRAEESAVVDSASHTLERDITSDPKKTSLHSSGVEVMPINWYLPGAAPNTATPPTGNAGVEGFKFLFGGEEIVFFSVTAYHHLNGLRLAAAGPEKAIALEDIVPLGVQAANLIFPAIEILNVGECGRVDADAILTDPDAAGRWQRESCVEKARPMPPTDGKRFTITY